MTTRVREVVCIIDDDASLRRSLRNLLSAEGFRVEMFDSAETFLASAAIEYAACLLVDLRMPGMSGLDLLQHLASSGPHAPVIIMTAHGEALERRRALSAGAVAFLEKPFDSGVLFDAIGKATDTVVPHVPVPHVPVPHVPVPQVPVPHVPVPQVPDAHVQDRVGARQAVHVAGGTLGRECHVCAFVNGADEQHRVLRSYIKEGLDAGEKGLHLVGSETRGDHVRRLGEAGIDVAAALDRGQLEVQQWEDTYLRADRFDQDAMLKLVDEALQSNAGAGYAHTRIVANMEWALLNTPGVEDLIEYEARANSVLCKHQASAICTYDVTKFSASVIVDVMRAHPMVIIGGVLQENPFFVPPEQFLLELRERRRATDN